MCVKERASVGIEELEKAAKQFKEERVCVCREGKPVRVTSRVQLHYSEKFQVDIM